jgi:hypothetical protein
MKRSYKKGDRVCHYHERKVLRVMKVMKHKSGAIGYLVGDSDGFEVLTSASAIEPYPQSGDEVLLLPGVYVDWLYRQICKERNEKRRQGRLINEYDPLRYKLPRWMNEVLMVEKMSFIGDEPIALVRSTTGQHRTPVNAIKVLSKAATKQQQESKAS